MKGKRPKKFMKNPNNFSKIRNRNRNRKLNDHNGGNGSDRCTSPPCFGNIFQNCVEKASEKANRQIANRFLKEKLARVAKE